MLGDIEPTAWNHHLPPPSLLLPQCSLSVLSHGTLQPGVAGRVRAGPNVGAAVGPRGTPHQLISTVNCYGFRMVSNTALWPHVIAQTPSFLLRMLMPVIGRASACQNLPSQPLFCFLWVCLIIIETRHLCGWGRLLWWSQRNGTTS